MKNKNALYTGLITSIIILSLIYSCTKEEAEIVSDDLQLKMIDIEGLVSGLQFSSEFVSTEITNTVYFDKLDETKKVESRQLMDDKIIELSSYDVSIAKFSKESSSKRDVVISKEEEIIYNSLFRSLKGVNKNSIVIVDFYIKEIGCLKFNTGTKKKCLENLHFFKDLLIYYSFDSKENTLLSASNLTKSLNLEEKPKWDCLYRDCMDCCMLAKLTALSNGNLLDFIKFLINPPVNTAWMFASCGFDCIFNNSK
jgi:hypothetical protein